MTTGLAEGQVLALGRLAGSNRKSPFESVRHSDRVDPNIDPRRLGVGLA